MRHALPLFMSSALFATATASAGGMDVAVFGGLSRTNLQDEDETLFSPRTFGLFGMGVEKHVSDRLSLVVQATYLPKGAIFSHRSGQPFRAGYLELPLLLKGSLAPRSAVTTHLLLGPTVGVRITASDPVYHSFFFPRSELIADPTTFRRIDVGVALGGGVGVRVGAGRRAFAEVLWARGLVDLDSREAGSAFCSFKMRALMIRAGLSGPLGRR